MATRLAYTATPQTRSYILRQLRERDHENYLANLLLPKRVQFPHAATRVLNFEVANIRNAVSNEDLGKLRIAHFRAGLHDVLSGDSAPQTPVMEALADAVAKFPDVRFDALHRLIDAREADLAYPNHATMESLERFARDTQGVLIGLHAELLGGSEPRIADLAGTAVGLAIVLRGVPAHAASRLSYIPDEIVRSTDSSHRTLLSGEGDHAVFRVVAERAERLLKQADEAVNDISGSLKPAFWPLRMAEIYLNRLKKVGWNPFDHGLQVGLRSTYPLVLQVRLLRLRMFG